MKKTLDEARTFYQGVVDAVAGKLGVAPPQVGLDIVVMWGAVVKPRIDLGDGWYVEFTPFLRMQGDEKFFNWEPDDGGRGRGWKGDEVRIEYNRSGQVHPCPNCECGWDGYEMVEAKDAQAAAVWAERLVLNIRGA